MSSMGYETCACAYCGRREAMDLSRDVRFAGEYGPLCDDCLPLALRVVEANAADAADAANASPDPALLALDRELRIRSLLADRAANTAAANREIAQFGQWRWDHDAADKACADAIAALLATDGAGEASSVCRWPKQGADPRVTSCGQRIAFNLSSDGEPCPSCGGRIVEVADA